MATPDLGHKLTEEELNELERRIASMYREAQKDLQGKVDDYFAKFVKRDAEQKALLDAGDITKEQYTQWRLARIGRGERYQVLRDQVAERMTKANEVAAAYMNDKTPGIYSLNRNYTAYTIEQVHGNVGFTLWDEQTVKRLIVESPDIMPYYPEKRAVKRGIDLAWGKKQITAQVTTGILQGESIKHISDRLQKNIPDMNRDSAIRAARTAFTGAQNAGRQDTYIAAKEMGLKLRKRWIATKDGRTRHDHGMADGQIVALDKPFEVGGYDMMFPGDMQSGAPGHLLYNCRCTMATVEKEGIEAEPRQMRVRDPETGRNVLVNEMTFDEWQKSKRVLENTVKPPAKKEEKPKAPVQQKNKPEVLSAKQADKKPSPAKKEQQYTGRDLQGMSREKLVSISKKIYVENAVASGRTKEEAVSIFDNLISDNSTTYLRKYIVGHQL